MVATGVCCPEYELVLARWLAVLPDKVEQVGFMPSLGGYRSGCLLHLQSLQKAYLSE